MAFPPNDIPATDLFIKLSAPERPSEIIDFPRRDPYTRLPIGKVRIQVLNMAEYDEARIKAQLWVVDKKKVGHDQLEGQAIKEVIGDRVAKELISMACLSVDPIKDSEQTGHPKYLRHFRNADAVDVLMADELEALWMTFQMVQRKYGPFEGNLDGPEQVTAWMRRLVEGGSALPLGQLGWHLLVELTMSLAERAYSLSAVLASQSSNLPNTLAAPLTSWDIGTSSFGKLPLSAIEIGLTDNDTGYTPLSEEQLDAMQERIDKKMAPLLPDRPVTSEEAAKLFEQMFKNGV